MPSRQAPNAVKATDFHPMEWRVADLLNRLQDRSDKPTHTAGVSKEAGDWGHNMAQLIARAGGLPIAFFSLETKAPQLTDRMLCAMGRIDLDHLHTGNLTNDEWHRLPQAVEQLQALQLHIDDTPRLGANELGAKARRLAQQCGPLGLIVVGTLQQVEHASGDNATRAAANAMLTRDLQMLARELHCPVIAFSELAACPR